MSGTCVAVDGGPAGGSAAGGSAAGGSAAGGAAGGGSAAGGSAAGGSAAGGSAAGGSAAGGSAAGGSAAGGAPDAGFNNTWTRFMPMGTITARGQVALGSDATTNSIFLFGGVSASNYVTDTWKLSMVANQLTWTQVLVTGAPPPGRGSQAVAFDSARRKLLVHSGANGSMPENTTWAFDVATTTWSAISTSGPARSAAAMAFDSTRNVTLLFGGRAPDTSDSDQTWEFNGTSWTLVTTQGPPPPAREAHVAFYDPVGNVFYVSGGYQASDSTATGRSDTWALTGLGTGTLRWQQLGGASYPGRWAASIAYDADRRVFVMFGGNSASRTAGGVQLSDTWVFDPATQAWRAGLNAQVPLLSPMPRAYVGLTWSPIHRAVLLFGGYRNISSTTEDNETWAYGWP
ncbi:MAG: kelch repeat-containing protein [Myxococcales bacterium]|nr:kelch repeat-containing protein [Myxococcales bacterium]